MPFLIETIYYRLSRNGEKQIIRIEPEFEDDIRVHKLYRDNFGRYEFFYIPELVAKGLQTTDYLGRIMIDQYNNWIYDGEFLVISEQETIAALILGSIDI